MPSARLSSELSAIGDRPLNGAEPGMELRSKLKGKRS